MRHQLLAAAPARSSGFALTPRAAAGAEGTNLHAASLRRSREYARANQLREYEHLLQPRIRGVACCLRQLDGLVHAVWDMTVAYPDVVPVSAPDLLRGRIPRSVCFHCERIPVQELSPLLASDDALTRWLVARWDAKEDRLARFYAMPPTQRVFDGRPLDVPVRGALWRSLLFWTALGLAATLLLWFSALARRLFLVAHIMLMLTVPCYSLALLERDVLCRLRG